MQHHFLISYVCFITVDCFLRCMQCTHMGYNRTYNFENVNNVYTLLNSKNNPQCAMQYPLGADSRYVIWLTDRQTDRQASLFYPLAISRNLKTKTSICADSLPIISINTVFFYSEFSVWVVLYNNTCEYIIIIKEETPIEPQVPVILPPITETSGKY